MKPTRAVSFSKSLSALAEGRAVTRIGRPSRITAPAIPAALALCTVLPEGDDAALNGMTRSLQRRLFGLNVPAVGRAA